MRREDLFNKIITGEAVTIDEIKPYKRSLKTLLVDYYGARIFNEALVVTLGGYGTCFFIPQSDLSELCYKDFLESGEDESELESFEANFYSQVGTLEFYFN